MNAHGKRTIKVGLTVGLSLGAIVGMVGCGDQVDGTDQDVLAAAQSENGLSMNGLSMNGLSMNGLSMNGLSMNGLSMNGLSMNGLSAVNGLKTTSGLMTTAGGRQIVQYMVKCAYPSGHNLITKDQNGMSYTFPGSLGVAPEAEFGSGGTGAPGSCGPDCQERLSACMLAHVNNSGMHVSIWLDSEGAIGWGQSPDFPYREGSFYGNMIVNPWKGFYCNGPDYGSAETSGRLGSPLASNVYVDQYGTGVGCAQSCTAHGTDGVDSCRDISTGYSWKHVVTVWRNFDAANSYKICNKSTGKCLGVVASSTADGAKIEQRAFSGAANQLWAVSQVSTGKYRIINVASGKSLDQSGASPNQLVQKVYTGTATQLSTFTSLGDQTGFDLIKPPASTAGFFVPSASDGAIAQLDDNLSSDLGKWNVMGVGMLPAGWAPATSSGGGSGGGSGGTNPCASFCANPTVFTATGNSPNLGVGASCRETTLALGGAGVSNMTGKTFTINGAAFSGTLPAKVNGGYCFQASAGGVDYASFYTW